MPPRLFTIRTTSSWPLKGMNDLDGSVDIIKSKSWGTSSANFGIGDKCLYPHSLWIPMPISISEEGTLGSNAFVPGTFCKQNMNTETKEVEIDDPHVYDRG
jgi:hypothetical protein